jgi:FkbM family methyltransferase
MNIKNALTNIFRSRGFDLVRYDSAFVRKTMIVRVGEIEFVFWIANLTGRKWYSGQKYFDHVESIELLKLIRPGMRVLEIGCNHGLFSCLMAKAVGPTGKVVAVDCVAENVLICSANAYANRFNNLTVLKYAVTERSQGEVCVDSGTNGFVVSEPNLGDTEYSESISIDELSATFGPFDLLKIDVEGYEACILRGANQTLTAISALALEIHGGEAGLKRYQCSPNEVMKLIAPYGFQGVCFDAVDTRLAKVSLVDYDPRNVPDLHRNYFLRKRSSQ